MWSGSARLQHAPPIHPHWQVGRKLPLIISMAGAVGSAGVYALVAMLDLDFWVLYVGSVVTGFSGGFSLFLMALFAACVNGSLE